MEVVIPVRKKTFDAEALFQPPTGAARITGFSVKFIRDGCRDGSIPSIRIGADYRVNMRLYLEKLDALSEGR